MRLVILGVLLGLVSACWQQNEVIAIEKGGGMKWLVIAKPDWELSTVKGVEDDLAAYTRQMTNAGWAVSSATIIAKDTDVVVSLKGNLQTVARTTDFYKIHSVSESMVKIEFLCPRVDDYRVYRTIKIKDANRAAIGCAQGVQTFRY